MKKITTACLLLFFSQVVLCQQVKLFGRVTNQKMEPIAFTSIQLKGLTIGTTSKEDGSYELAVSAGKWDVIVTMIGYESQVFTLTIPTEGYRQNIILQESAGKELSGVSLNAKQKDFAEQLIRKVIEHKNQISLAAGAYSCDIYVRAIKKDSTIKKIKSAKVDTIPDMYKDIRNMSMAEVSIRLDKDERGRINEERIGITKRGNVDDLFFLTTTDGDFSLYNNLINVPKLSAALFLSPISYSGLLAYRYQVDNVDTTGGRKVYTISIKPRQLSNATVEGKVKILAGEWVVVESSFYLPRYHLPRYDEFIVNQGFTKVDDSVWMMDRQSFYYTAKSGRFASSGETVVHYQNFSLNKKFPPRYFGLEVGSTAMEAYKKDSSFWQTVRAEPLTDKELKFIYYTDSVYRARHTKAFLDSLDRKINKVTFKKIILTGQEIYNREKERRWVLPSVIGLIQPFSFGGFRISPSLFYSKTFATRKNISVFTNLSYGIRNKDINGNINLTRMYNPFNRGFYRFAVQRDFQYIFNGDAWINMLQRSNIYLNTSLGVGHGLEIANGLMLYNDLDISFRRSVSNYKTNDRVDSLFGNVLTNNQPIAFASYNALYGKVRLQYTPRQHYLREPLEKIILGSKWPTFYTEWRGGLPGVANSKVNFNFLELGVSQQIKLGIAGISTYKIITGSFLSMKDLRLVDYKFQRRGDPILFLNPNEAFQALDSTFPVFNRFYEGHYVHEFNGALINKIPLLKKLNLRETAGVGFLFAPERKLRYVEAFAGLERVFKWPFSPLDKFKVGIYIVGSAANQFKSPVQFKIGFTTWDKRRNKWN